MNDDPPKTDTAAVLDTRTVAWIRILGQWTKQTPVPKPLPKQETYYDA